MTLRELGIAALLVSLGAGMTSNLLFLAAFQFRIDWMLEPALVVGAGATSAELLRWAAALDLIGYYLASAVLGYVLWRLLRPRHAALADLSTMGVIGFALVGGAGAAVLAMLGPMLMYDYAAASDLEQQALVAGQFALLLEVVWRSIWQLLDPVLVGAWWLGLSVLIRADQPGLSRLSLALAVLAFVAPLITLLGLDLVRDVALGIAFALWTAWWVWLLVLFLRTSDPFAAAP